MCEYSGRLVAWMDREVEASEAAEIERHVRACAECRSCVAEFERVSGAFEEYCEAVVKSKEDRNAIRLEPVLWAAAAAIVLAVMLVYPKRGVAPPKQQPSMTAAARTDSSPTVTPKATGNVGIPFEPDRHTARPKATASAKRGATFPRPCLGQGCAPEKAVGQTPNMNWAADDPAIQIAIPAEAMFPPGAMPEGVNFVADVSIGADGMAEQLRLRPRPVRFERRANQP
jgi:anti-sigma factor RsiW